MKEDLLGEKFCVDDPKESVLTLSQIIDFAHSPTDRFKTEGFRPVLKNDDHGHHE